MWIYILILFATHVLILLFGMGLGYLIKTNQEQAYPPGDPENKEDPKARAPYEYEISYPESSGPQPKRKGHIFAIIAIPLLIILPGCLPSSTPEPEVIERHCAIADLKPKPTVPAVEWLIVDGLMCVDPENYVFLKTRQSLISTYANYCTTVYKQTQERCKE